MQLTPPASLLTSLLTASLDYCVYMVQVLHCAHRYYYNSTISGKMHDVDMEHRAEHNIINQALQKWVVFKLRNAIVA